MIRTYPLQLHVLTLFLGLILLVGGLMGGVSQHLARSLMESVADDLSLRIGREVRGELRQVVQPAEMALKLLRHDALVSAPSLEARLQSLPMLRSALSGSAALSSIYLGYGDGDFFFVRHLESDEERQRFGAPAQAAYLVQSIEHDNGHVSRGYYVYFDEQLQRISVMERADYAAGFDPRTRPWYQRAPADGSPLVTEPYRFFSDREVGVSLARRVPESATVLGADIRLRTLGASLARQKVTAGTRLALVNVSNRVIAQEAVSAAAAHLESGEGLALPLLTELGHPAFASADELVQAARSSGASSLSRSVQFGGDAWLLSATVLESGDAEPLFLVMAIPERELLAGAYRQRDVALLVTLLVLCIAIPLTWLLARQIARPLRALAADAAAIRRFRFARSAGIVSRIREVAELSDTMDGMKATIRRFLDLSTAVAGEANFDRLLPRLLGETLSATQASCGVLYLVAEGRLAPVAALRADGTPLAVVSAGTDSDAELGPWQSLPLGADHGSAVALDATGPLMGDALAAQAVRSAALQPADLAALGLQGRALGVSHAMAVPLLNRQGDLVGAMLLLLDEPGDEDRLAFAGALSGSAAVTLEARGLIAAQKALFEALVRMIAGAIDAKSQHTGGHCARVPELARLLAKAACEADSGPYADFQLGDSDWETLRIAAWMHDCGKITTPEYVVEKGTKLQTLYDRLHEIRMRFEVLKREAEIRCLQGIVDGGDAAQCTRVRDEELAALDADFAFVASCNQGSEAMAEADVERLQQIAQRRWMRTLDDCIGLSHEEAQRRASSLARPLPVAEPLLADRPEHLFERRDEAQYRDDNPWGFRMPAPRWHTHQGELHNLSVRYGTLTEEERYLINEHIIQTEIMLRQLPFPRHLANVPEVAASHHEKMDGSGYPKRLTGAQMSPMARMMAVADIFEALTARDRPYKRGKTLSEATTIMARMAGEGHIDPALFALFLRSGAYLEYGRRFIDPAQFDEVDVEALLAGLQTA